jgi:hypothetical protein
MAESNVVSFVVRRLNEGSLVVEQSIDVDAYMQALSGVLERVEDIRKIFAGDIIATHQLYPVEAIPTVLTTDELFVHEAEALRWAQEHQDGTAIPLLLAFALTEARGAVRLDPVFETKLRCRPMDLLFFARAVGSLFSLRDVAGVLSGRIASLDELDF